MPRFLLIALTSGVLVASASSRAQQSPDLARLVRDQVASAADLDTNEIWRRAAGLRDFARQLEGQSLDAVVDSQLAATEPVSEAGLLLLAGLRLSGSDPDVVRLATKLTPLLDSTNDKVAEGAAGLLADPNFKTLSAEERQGAVASLLSVAEDGARAPELRLEAAHSLYELDRGEARRRAWKLMQSFLDSSDPELRALGALTLARSRAEITGQLYDELRRLAALPGERGLLADSYLRIEQEREYQEAMFRRRVKLLEEEPDKPAVAGSLTPAQIFERVLEYVQRGHLEGDKVDPEDLLDAALDGMLGAMDEHSAFMANKEFARFEQDLEAGYGGIGAYVDTDQNDKLFTITKPIYSGPAYKAGLMSEDKIVRIEDWPTIGQPTDEVIKRLKGRPGTPVKLYVWRRGMDVGLIDRPTEEMAVSIERAAITIPAVQYQMLPGKIGMVALNDFSRVATVELRSALTAMKEAGMQSLVLDLRGNPGGLLDEAVDVSSLFLPKGSLVVRTESRVEAPERRSTTSEPILPADMPVAVLINRFSASASEIVAGALQDHGRATLVGTRSFGKGSVQKLLSVKGTENDEYTDENGNGRHDNWEPITKDWNGNGEFDFAPHLKLTIAKYLLPSGRSIHRELDKEGNIISPGGVDPDVEVDRDKLDTWRIEEMYKVRDTGLVRDYVEAQMPKNRALFEELAVNDKKDVSRYPEFDDLMARLNTPLPADDVRQLVRYEVRRRVQDLRGQEFPPGDFVEDAQLQAAIRLMLADHGETPQDYDEYNATIPEAPTARLTVAAVERSTLKETLDKVTAARKGDGKLSLDLLRRLEELLSASLEGAAEGRR